MAIRYVLLLAFWIFMMRRCRAAEQSSELRQEPGAAALIQQKKVTFKDVAGVEEAKEELQEIIEFLREPQKFQKLGAASQRRTVIGPPVHRQDAASRAIAGEPMSGLLHLRFGLR